MTNGEKPASAVQWEASQAEVQSGRTEDGRPAGGQRAEYDVISARSAIRFTLGGRPPARTIDLDSPKERMAGTEPRWTEVIFAVDAARNLPHLSITRHLHTESAEQPVPGAPDRPVVPVGWRVVVP